MPRYIPDDALISAVQTRSRHATSRAAAAEMGLSESTFKDWLKYAARRGFMGTKPILEGFGISRTTAVTDGNGNIVRQFVQQRPLHESTFELPEGHRIKGVSALLDGSGAIQAQWIKTSLDAENQEKQVEAIKSIFEAYSGFATIPPVPETTDDELLTTYIVGDHHLGLLSWAKESGDDYDLHIGEKTLREAMGRLVSQAPSSKTALILNLGDFFHSDSPKNRTELSGNALDVDGRFAKIMRLGVQLLIDCIEQALQKHETVLVRCLPGNHDPNSAIYLSIALSAFFAKNERVTVDCDPSKFFWYTFGTVFIGATHGDMVKPEQMPGVMASYRAEDWGRTKHRYAYFGHVHHRSKGGGEMHGVVWETFQTLAAKDYWHSSSGYSSGRSMTAITHHRERGEVYRHMVQAQ